MYTPRSGGYERFPATLATVLFFFNGGLGFLYLFSDWRKSHLGLADFMSSLRIDYTYFVEANVQWANLVADILLPQRTALFGIPIAMMVFTLFVAAWDRCSHKGVEASPWDGWRLLLPAGLLTGMLPYFHTHTFLAIGLVSSFLFVVRPRRTWLFFWAASILLALPFLFELRGHIASGSFVRFQPGWLNHGKSNWIIYWIRNIGLPTLLIFPAWLVAPPAWRRFYLAFACLLVFSLLVIVSPNDFDNIKLIYYWYALTCVFVAAWPIRLAFVRQLPLLALSLALVSVASGLLAVYVQGRTPRPIFSDGQITAAAFVREHTAPRALFLETPAPMPPVLRRLVSLWPREFASRVAKDPHQMLVEFPRAFFAVYRYYKVAYGRLPRYAWMKGYMEMIGRGIYVGACGWQESPERNGATMTEAWCDGPEFNALYGGKTDAQYVDILYANAGLTPGDHERDEMVARLGEGKETRLNREANYV